MANAGHQQRLFKRLSLRSSSAHQRQRICRSFAQRPDALRTKTPHSGFHLDGDRDFFEGWYFRVTNPETGQSMALMYAYEQGLQRSGVDARVSAQAMGPNDSYICQTSTDKTIFWGDRNKLALGACFKPAPARSYGDVPKELISEAAFPGIVGEGFQATDTFHQGYIADKPGTVPGKLKADIPGAYWAFTVQPVYGWGHSGEMQQSTAGWLSALPVLEPHWQVLTAHGLANGYVQWGEDERIELNNAPFYAEKNWGHGFPKKWAWVQCNTFTGQPNLAVTAAVAIRNILNIPGVDEELGLIGIHTGGEFIELAATNCRMRWDIEPWGSWHIWAKNEQYEALLEASCADDAGAVLRAPQGQHGFTPACRDTFDGVCRLRVWRLDGTGIRTGAPIVEAESTTAALEVGGGPWWSAWCQEANTNQAIAAAVQVPVASALDKLEQAVPFEFPSIMKPPGY